MPRMVNHNLGCLKERPVTARGSKDEILAHCASCKCERLFVAHEIQHLRHFMSTLLTGGLWLVVWLVVALERSLRPWRCSQCGWYKPEFTSPLLEALQTGEAALLGMRSRQQSPIVLQEFTSEMK
jgi:hypothetical protein